MLKKLGPAADETGAVLPVSQCAFPAPFRSTLEFGAPARGTWNIVHVGMLIPESHQVFVCASNCLRGVVLTAAEMGEEKRFSTVTIKENNVLEGDMETLLIEGVSDILSKLPEMPPAVLVYTSCIHHFMGCDLDMCYNELRRRFPGVAFTDCYMNPIMRKSGLTPDQLMRRQLYSLLEPKPLNPAGINIIGNNYPTDYSSDLITYLTNCSYIVRDITYCSTYEEYQQMATSLWNISYNPVAIPGGKMLSEKLGQKHLHLPLYYTADKIRGCMQELAAALGAPYDGGYALEQKAEAELARVQSKIGDTAIAIDYTFTMYPLNLTRMLLEHGFRVDTIYVDSFNGAEKEDFQWLQENYPDVVISATVHPKMRILPRNTSETVLALGQKAAYFTGTTHFVNIVEGGGMYGFDGVYKLAKLMEEAFITERDASQFIQQKGLGCSCCL